MPDAVVAVAAAVEAVVVQDLAAVVQGPPTTLHTGVAATAVVTAMVATITLGLSSSQAQVAPTTRDTGPNAQTDVQSMADAALSKNAQSAPLEP